MLCFWIELLALLMKIYFLITKSQSLPVIAKGDNAHAKDSMVEFGRCLNIFDRQHKMVKPVYFHIEKYDID